MTRYHDLKTKIESIRLRKEGRRSTDIGRMLGVSVSQIDRWQNLYEAHGERGLSNKNRVVTYEKKRALARKVLEKGLSCEQVSLKAGCGRSSLCHWVALVLESGNYEVLKPKRNGKNEENRSGRRGTGETSRGSGVSPRGEHPFKKNIRDDAGEEKRGRVEKAREIARLSKEHPLSVLLHMANMPRSTYYYRLSRPVADKRMAEKRAIMEIYERSRRTYGYRRITMAMRSLGYNINHKTVRKLMVSIGIRAVQKRKKYRSYRGTVGKVAENILSRDFKADAPGLKLATDISQINIAEKKLYISAMIDMFNGEVVAYRISESPNLKLVMSMMRRALRKNVFRTGCIMHSDQGWHYQHHVYTSFLKSKNIIQSMSRKGNCLDNAMMESFFGTLKSEFVYLHKYRNKDMFVSALDKYIAYYNNERIKLRLKTSPVRFKELFL